jgi:Zn-dependent M28 family amino/carboxypeptidase
MSRFKFRAVLCSLLVLGAAAVAVAEPQALLRIDRPEAATRELLLGAGVAVVAELEQAVLAVGPAAVVEAEAASLGLSATVLDPSVEGSRYALAGLREGATVADLAGCGERLWQEDSWILVRDPQLEDPVCMGSTHFMMTPLRLDSVRPAQPPPAGFDDVADGAPELLDPDPLVVDMLTQLDTAFALAHWQGLVNAASTRYSTSSGCQTAATYVYNLFDAYGLNPEYQPHTGGHAPNVIGTIPGRVTPEQVYILIGHLDDMPSSGPAPGADDNASGTVMVTALAELMSVYDFASTVKFIAVTGEEFGLYGSEHYADAAAAAGEDIEAVFNADMIGWQGNGTPNPENLDINYNTASAWMGTLLDQVAADYPVGLAVNDFLCNDMAYSDHWPFWQQGYSAVCAITDNEGFCGQAGSYPYYHTSNDTIANCGAGGPAFLAASMRLFLAAAGHLADPLCVRTAVPTGLIAQPMGANRIDLAWSSAGSGLSYEVHRTPGGCVDPGPDTLVGETTNLSLSDTTASGGMPYGYTVRSKDPSGYCLSEPSACVEAQTTGACTEPPYFAGVEAVINAADATCLLTVDWAPPIEVYCGGAVAYNVYRSTISGFVPGPSNRVASLVAATSWDDFDVVYGERYYYVVRAVDLSNGAEDHNTAERSGAPTGPPDIGTWLDDAGDTDPAQLTPTSPWTVATTGGHSAPKVYATGSYPDNVCAGITSDVMHLGTSPQLTFWSKYGIESSWDKGEVQVSANGGSTWVRVPVNYPGNSTNTSDECGLPTGTYFTGTNTTYAQYSASLATWANQDIIIRWVLSTDTAVGGSGWWVDDITITNVEVPSSCESGGSPYPGAFAKSAPLSGATGQPTDVTLSWNASSNVTGYEVCVDTVDNGLCDAAWDPVGNVMSTLVGGLDESTAYSWQVRAVNGSGSTEADGGVWWTFITTPYLFGDGFESGDVGAWSAVAP